VRPVSAGAGVPSTAGPQHIRILTNQPQAERYAAQPNFDSFKILNEDATMIKMKKTSILWRKLTYVLGFIKVTYV
jgi:hypothetical protein